MSIRIGIDVGGTNTDAVLMDGLKVLSSRKTTTTSDVSSGIVASLEAVLKESPDHILHSIPELLTALNTG